MSLYRELRWTLLIQSLGALSSLGTVVLVGLLAGAAAQGAFSRLKSTLDLLMAVAMLGIPQGLLYFQRQGMVTREKIVQLTQVTALLGLTSALAYGLFAEGMALTTLVLLAVTTAAGAAHGVMRGAILAGLASSAFNAITVLPQVLLMLGAVAVPSIATLAGTDPTLPFFLAWLSSAAVAALMTRKLALPTPATSVGLVPLMKFSTAAWLVAVFTSASPALWLHHIGTTSGLQATGLFAMGLVGVQVVLTPANYAAPLLFKHWIGNASLAPTKAALRYGLGVLAAMAVCVSVLQLAPWPSVLSEYALLANVAGYFAAVAVLESILRIACVACNAQGRPWHAVAAELARLLVLMGTILIAPPAGLEALAQAWALASLSAVIALACTTRLWPAKPASLTP